MSKKTFLAILGVASMSVMTWVYAADESGNTQPVQGIQATSAEAKEKGDADNDKKKRKAERRERRQAHRNIHPKIHR